MICSIQTIESKSVYVIGIDPSSMGKKKKHAVSIYIQIGLIRLVCYSYGCVVIKDKHLELLEFVFVMLVVCFSIN